MTWLQVLLLCGVILWTGYLLAEAISHSISAAAKGIESELSDVKLQLEMLDHTLDKDSDYSEPLEPFQHGLDPPIESGKESPKE